MIFVHQAGFYKNMLPDSQFDYKIPKLFKIITKRIIKELIIEKAGLRFRLGINLFK